MGYRRKMALSFWDSAVSVEMEIAAISAGPQCLGAAETDFFQVTKGVIVTFTEKTADFRTAA